MKKQSVKIFLMAMLLTLAGLCTAAASDIVSEEEMPEQEVVLTEELQETSMKMRMQILQESRTRSMTCLKQRI